MDQGHCDELERGLEAPYNEIREVLDLSKRDVEVFMAGVGLRCPFAAHLIGGEAGLRARGPGQAGRGHGDALQPPPAGTIAR